MDDDRIILDMRCDIDDIDDDAGGTVEKAWPVARMASNATAPQYPDIVDALFSIYGNECII